MFCQSLGQQEHEYHSAEYVERIAALFNHHLEDYNKLAAPLNRRPLLVKLHFYIIAFSDISEINMDFTLSYFMQITWRDDRLSFRPEHFRNIPHILLYPDQIHTIWLPDIMYINEKGESVSKPISLSNSASRIYPSGDVYLVRKLETKFHCQMKLQNYPFDIQMCYMDIASFTFTADLLNLGLLGEPPVDFCNDVELSTFELPDIITQESNETVTSGTFHTLKIIFKLRRFINFYFLQVKNNFIYQYKCGIFQNQLLLSVSSIITLPFPFW